MNQNINQLDGNDSLNSSLPTSELSCRCCDSISDAESVISDKDQDPDFGAAIPVLETNHIFGRNNLAQYTTPPAWYDAYIPEVNDPRRAKVNLKTIRRDNRLMMTESLPILSVSNCRSIWPKLNSFKNDMKMRDISCAMLSEVWQKANCKKQQFELEKMLNMDGIKYISTPRMTKRGGGAAICVSLENFSLDKIEVSNPNKVEVVFGLLRQPVR